MLKRQIITVIVYTIAFIIIGFSVNWWAVLGLILFGWGINLENSQRGE